MAKPASGLNSKQQRALGAYNAPWIWQDAFRNLHPEPVAGAIDRDEEEQSYEQFVNMGRREPNERGTGRWRLETGRKTIGILPDRNLMEGDSTKNGDLVEQVRTYFAAFFYELDIAVLPPMEMAVSATQRGNKKRKTNQSNVMLRGSAGSYAIDSLVWHDAIHVEVFSIFDALVPYLRDDLYCVVALTNLPLVEREVSDVKGASDNYHQVQGRACGDRVCCVSTHGDISLRSLLATATHEALHTFGLDHCTTFACLMNSMMVEDEETIFLSPLNLKKWVCAVFGYSSKNDSRVHAYVVKRYEAMELCLVDLELGSDAAWVRRKLNVLNGS